MLRLPVDDQSYTFGFIVFTNDFIDAPTSIYYCILNPYKFAETRRRKRERVNSSTYRFVPRFVHRVVVQTALNLRTRKPVDKKNKIRQLRKISWILAACSSRGRTRI